MVFGHDGHDSVRILYDLAHTATNTISALATYTAYGVLLSTHNTLASVHATSFTLQTSLGYSGELWDAASQQQYLRARYYNPANGGFNRLDPFQGNMQDPQSLHKYDYMHGDPVQGIDPAGESLISTGMCALAVGFGKLNATSTVMNSHRSAKYFTEFATSLHSGYFFGTARALIGA